MPNQTPEQSFVELVRRLRDEDNAARRHRRIRYEEDGRSLADLFDEKLAGNDNLALLLSALKEKNSVRTGTEGRKLVSPGKPDESLFFAIITPGSDDEIRSMSQRFEADDRETVKRWIESLAVVDSAVVEMPPTHSK